MFNPKVAVRMPTAGQAAQISRAVAGLTSGSFSSACQPSVRLGYICTARHFSTSPKHQIKTFFPAAEDTKRIRKTDPAWPHPGFTPEQMEAIKPEHRPVRNISDFIAYSLIRTARFGMDLFTNYKEVPENVQPGQKVVYPMSDKKWLTRVIFLESVAGVPGMVGGMLRHFNSMRRMRRDNGWIETLIEESYNERMHLLTFLKMAEPGIFMRLMVLGAQGVMFNALLLSYLISPSGVHRFVGYLEEQAVHTYTKMIQDMDNGYLPEWTDPNFKIPDIAIDYWRIPKGEQTMRNLILYIRADEAKHREVNHTLGNLKQQTDPNPFVSKYDNDTIPHPCKGIQHHKGKGWERSDVI